MRTLLLALFFFVGACSNDPNSYNNDQCTGSCESHCGAQGMLLAAGSQCPDGTVNQVYGTDCNHEASPVCCVPTTCPPADAASDASTD